MIEALIAGQRSPKALAKLAKGRMRPKPAQLAEALDGRFEDHHGELARIILDQIDALTGQTGTGPGAPVLPALMRLDEITGCGVIAASAGRTGTFPGERYRRLARRRGKRKAITAVARSILVIIFHLLADPEVRFRDLGTGYYDPHIDRERKIRNHIRQLEALGLDVTTATRHGAA
jgi:hypothetical protein